jgi:hypothetical protein
MAAKMCSIVAATMTGGNNGHRRLMELQSECVWQNGDRGCGGNGGNERR